MRLEGCRDGRSRLLLCVELYVCPSWGIKLEKFGFDGCLFPIMLPITVGLGGSIADELNALAFVPAIGGRIHSSHYRIRRSQLVEPLSIRRTLFPCSRPWSTSKPGDYVCKSERQVRVSIYLRIPPLWMLVVIPLIGILDSGPRASA